MVILNQQTKKPNQYLQLSDRDRGYSSQPEDRYYPSYYATGSLPRDKSRSPHTPQSPPGRANIDHYATLTPSERLRNAQMDQHGMSV